jgi:hypothetical protein
MSKLFVLVVMTALAIASGCGVDARSPAADDPTQHEFTRDLAGGAVPANASVLEEFTPLQSFDHTMPSAELNAAEAEDQVCAGACDSDICVCVGDFDCCVVGCILCWEILEI